MTTTPRRCRSSSLSLTRASWILVKCAGRWSDNARQIPTKSVRALQLAGPPTAGDAGLEGRGHPRGVDYLLDQAKGEAAPTISAEEIDEGVVVRHGHVGDEVAQLLGEAEPRRLEQSRQAEARGQRGEPGRPQS